MDELDRPTGVWSSDAADDSLDDAFDSVISSFDIFVKRARTRHREIDATLPNGKDKATFLKICADGSESGQLSVSKLSIPPFDTYKVSTA